MDIYFQVGANTTFRLYEMFTRSVAVATCQYGATAAPAPSFIYQMLDEDGTAL